MPDGLLDSLMLYRGLAVLGEVVIEYQDRSRFGMRPPGRSERENGESTGESGVVVVTTSADRRSGDTTRGEQEIKEEGEKLEGSPDHGEERGMEAQRIEDVQGSLTVLRPFCSGIAEKQVFEGLWGISQALKDGVPVDSKLLMTDRRPERVDGLMAQLT